MMKARNVHPQRLAILVVVIAAIYASHPAAGQTLHSLPDSTYLGGVSTKIVDNPYTQTASPPASTAQVAAALGQVPATLVAYPEAGPTPSVSGSGACGVCSGGVPGEACDACAAGCVDPFHPPVQVMPYEQPIPLAGCDCPQCMRGLDCAWAPGREQKWKDAQPINFGPLRHGEWIGPVRLPSMLEYRVRVGDQLRFIFIATRQQSLEPYRLMVGDQVAISSVTDENFRVGDLTRGLAIQPDGDLHLELIGSVQAAGLTIEELRKELDRRYAAYSETSDIVVLPVQTNTKLEDLNRAVSNFQTAGGQNVETVVNPDGRVQLPIIGAVRIIGMTLEEAKREINLRYQNADYWGILIEPQLTDQADHFVYVMGEVGRPGRYQLEGPTTVTHALAMAEGIRVGGNMRQVIVLRRAEDWRLLATMLDIRGELLGKTPTPADEIWLRDSDLIIVPPQPIRVLDNWIRLVFTEGIYGVAPAQLFSDD